MDSLYIAWQYVTHNKTKAAILIACITLIAALPLALQSLLDESERQLTARAGSTPLNAFVLTSDQIVKRASRSSSSSAALGGT